MSGIELYDSLGKVSLTSEDTFLTYPSTQYVATLGNSYNGASNNPWIMKPSNKMNRQQGPLASYSIGTTLPSKHIMLIQPLDGKTITYLPEVSGSIIGYGSDANTPVARYVSLGLDTVSSNFASGYLDAYNSNGTLTWSVNALSKSIQLMQVTTKEMIAGETSGGQAAYSFTVPAGYNPEDVYLLPISFFNQQRVNAMPDGQNFFMWTNFLVERVNRTFYLFPVSYIESVYGYACSIDNNAYNQVLINNGTTYDYHQNSFDVYVFWKPPS